VTGELRGFQYAVDTTLAVPPTRIVPVHGSRGEQPPQRLRLGEALVQAGVITPAQLDTCLRHQAGSTPRRRLGAVVVELGLATDVHVAQGLATILGFDFVDPEAYDVPVEVVRRLPRLTAEMLGAVPVAAGPTWVRVAVADPTDRYTVEALREATGVVNVSMAVATPRSIEAALHRFWSPEYAPRLVAVPAPETVPEPEPAAPAAPAAPEAGAAGEPAAAARGDGWEYAFVGDGVPSSHPGYTGDLAGTERELARLGALGWEAVGVQASGVRLTVLLKRKI
jgi:hypothetical protein